MSSSANIATQATQVDDAIVYSDLSESRRDYDRVCQILKFLSEHGRELPASEDFQSRFQFNEDELPVLIRRWAGLDVESFVEATTIDHARNMLQGSASLLELAEILGASGPARLHDLIVTHEALTQKELKKLGQDLEVRYGFHDCPLGVALVLVTDRGICGLGFCDDISGQEELLDDMKRWPDATYIADYEGTEKYVRHIFSPDDKQMAEPIRIVFIGTDFETKVWEALLKVPAGRAVTYSDLAEHIGSPGAHRAVGAAVGRNPISLVVPCHRVLRKDATLGGYHWGIVRKQAILAWETGKLRAEMEE